MLGHLGVLGDLGSDVSSPILCLSLCLPVGSVGNGDGAGKSQQRRCQPWARVCAASPPSPCPWNCVWDHPRLLGDVQRVTRCCQGRVLGCGFVRVALGSEGASRPGALLVLQPPGTTWMARVNFFAAFSGVVRDDASPRRDSPHQKGGLLVSICFVSALLTALCLTSTWCSATQP